MNRRDFLKGISLIVGGTAILPSELAYVLEAPLDKPLILCKREAIESGYSKLRITVFNRVKPIYMEKYGPRVPVDVICERSIRAEFDVPPSVAYRYAIGEAIPADMWPHISSLWPTRIDLALARDVSSATVNAELLDPGDGIDLSIIEKVMRRHEAS